MNGVTRYAHWQGSDGHGTPLHPTRQISDRPAIYEFSRPIKATYPPWYSPSYWYEGVSPKFDFNGHMQIMLSSISTYFNLLFRQQAGLVVGVLTAFLIGERRWLIVKDLARLWSLFIPALAALGMYALVHIEMRFLGGFVLLIWAGLFAGSLLTLSGTPSTATTEWKSPTSRTGQLVTYVSVAILFIANVHIAFNVAELIRKSPYPLIGSWDRAAHEQWQVANGLERLGIQTGDEVAFIGYSLDCYWARLAQVRIIADILQQNDVPDSPPDVEYYWTADETVRADAMAVFGGLGAKAVITDRVPLGASLNGWQQIGNTQYYVWFLEQRAEDKTSGQRRRSLWREHRAVYLAMLQRAKARRPRILQRADRAM